MDKTTKPSREEVQRIVGEPIVYREIDCGDEGTCCWMYNELKRGDPLYTEAQLLAAYAKGAEDERAVSDRLLKALKEAYSEGWIAPETYNDVVMNDFDEAFAKSDTAKLIAEVEAMRKEKSE